jgi:hypothetical protein
MVFENGVSQFGATYPPMPEVTTLLVAADRPIAAPENGMRSAYVLSRLILLAAQTVAGFHYVVLMGTVLSIAICRPRWSTGRSCDGNPSEWTMNMTDDRHLTSDR